MHLLLIGGGEIGAQRSDGSYRPLETLEIDLYFISLLSKVSPKILFIPTAIEQKDPKRRYEKAFIKLYEGKLNCKVETLYLKKTDNQDYYDNVLSSFDAIYIAGGDTAYMLKQWRDMGFDNALKRIALKNKVIAGISAGAMCWFEKVLSGTENAHLINGLGLLGNMCIPHWNKLKNDIINDYLIKQNPFIAIDNCCAIDITDNSIKIISAKEHASAYYCDISKNIYEFPITKEEIKKC